MHSKTFALTKSLKRRLSWEGPHGPRSAPDSPAKTRSARRRIAERRLLVDRRDQDNAKIPGSCGLTALPGPCLPRVLKLFRRQRSRVEICRDRHDRRSCKICSRCVNFPGKQRNFSHNLRRTTRFTHTKCDFALKPLKIYTLSKILTKSY